MEINIYIVNNNNENLCILIVDLHNKKTAFGIVAFG